MKKNATQYAAEIHDPSRHGKPLIFSTRAKRRKEVHAIVGRSIESEPYWISRGGVLEFRQDGISVDYFKVSPSA